MEKVIAVINELEREGIVQKYALGGGIAVLFYIEPVLTYDLDVFVFLPEQKAGGLLSLTPLYASLKEKGYLPEKEHVMIKGVPVQFIPVYNELVEEAVDQAVQKKYKGIFTRVVRLEHLLAIMLKTDRTKDRIRITALLEEADVNMKSLGEVLERHNLKNKWETFRRMINAKKK